MGQKNRTYIFIISLFLISFYLMNLGKAQTTNTTSNSTTGNSTTNSTSNSTTNSTKNSTTNTTTTNKTNTTTSSSTVQKVVINRNLLVNFTQNEVKQCIQQDCLPLTNKCMNTNTTTSNCTGNYTTYDNCIKNSTGCDYTNSSITSVLSPNCPQNCNATIYQNFTNTTKITLFENEITNLTSIAQCYYYCYGNFQYNSIYKYKNVNDSSMTNRSHAQYQKLVQTVIDEAAYNASLKNKNTTTSSGNSDEKLGYKLGMFVFPLQRNEDLKSTKEKRLAIGSAVIIVYMIHYLFLALVNFLPKEKINMIYFEQIEKFLYLFGFAALLSTNWLQTGLFHALLCWFTFIFAIALHLPALQMLGLEQMWQKIGKYVWLGFILLLCIWFWGIIIAYYTYWLSFA